VSLPVPTITLYLDLPFTGGDIFTIEDPVYGLIETGGGIAGDLGSADITASGYDITIRRGRNSVLDDIDVGTAAVAFRNYDRDWDPLNTASPYYGRLKPGVETHVDIYGQRIWTGYTDDWFNSYTVHGEAVGSFPMIDGLGVLARQAFNAWTATAAQTAGPRITAVLNRAEVGWPGGARDLDTGVSTLQGDSVTWGSDPFNYIKLIAQTDQGYAFVDRTGVFTYRDRRSLIDPTPTLTFTDDGTGIDFHGASLTGAGERFYSQVSVDREGGIVQTASDDGVGQASAIRRFSVSGLLMDSDEQAMSLAEWLLSLYKDPTPRIDSLTVNVSALADDPTRAQVSGIDIGDVIHVTWTPLTTGSTIDDDFNVEGVEHSIPYDGPHLMSLYLAPVTQQTVFTIEDDTLGVIEGPGRIAF